MDDLGEKHTNKTSNDIIKDTEAEIRELKDDLSKANFMVAFLQQENKQLRYALIQKRKPQEDPP